MTKKQFLYFLITIFIIYSIFLYNCDIGILAKTFLTILLLICYSGVYILYPNKK
jgi:hypothetical protein